MGDTVTYERQGRVAIIRYNRPEAMNAVNGELRRDLNAAWEQLRVDDDAWVAIVTGNGKAFCAGADLKDPGSAVGNDDHSFWEVPSFTSLESGKEIWKPVIAAVNGYAIGFGLTMVAACDFVVASERAEFGFPEVQLGVPTVQGSVRMPKMVGWQNAMELLLLGDRVSAERAKEMGLVMQVVPHDDVMEAALALADRLVTKSAPLAIRATKEIAKRGQEMGFVEAIRFGETMRKVAAATEDAAAFRKAASSGEKPVWTGR
ncbi:MAG: enoyl-CoA hydratase/isomerase family protein [Actinomycetota bacterium]|jgi:E-phenylitaconyl-CoA hydratase|nr:enoyl-CoA hydratase/isomerase family protein [Actinomycetota bacterium]